MTLFDELTFFHRDEFAHPDKLHPPFLRWLDAVRRNVRQRCREAGIPDAFFIVTSDWRNVVPPGGFDNSLHLVGRAIDFRWRIHTTEQRAIIVIAIATTPIPDGEGGFELGIEPTAVGGPHWHLGLFPAGQQHRLFVQ